MRGVWESRDRRDRIEREVSSGRIDELKRGTARGTGLGVVVVPALLSPMGGDIGGPNSFLRETAIADLVNRTTYVNMSRAKELVAFSLGLDPGTRHISGLKGDM